MSFEEMVSDAVGVAARVDWQGLSENAPWGDVRNDCEGIELDNRRR